jgi:hypothetical protein
LINRWEDYCQTVQVGISLIPQIMVDGQKHSILTRAPKGFAITQFYNTAEVDPTFYEKFYSHMTKGTFIIQRGFRAGLNP